MRIVLDTNVVVSAFIAKHGHPANLLQLALTVEEIELVLSQPVVKEIRQVLRRKEVVRRFSYTEGDVRQIVNTLANSATMVRVRSRFHVVSDDPKDDIVLNTAYDGKADFIVSGDRHLLKLGTFKGIRIVNPKQMTSIIAQNFPDFVIKF